MSKETEDTELLNRLSELVWRQHLDEQFKKKRVKCSISWRTTLIFLQEHFSTYIFSRGTKGESRASSASSAVRRSSWAE